MENGLSVDVEANDTGLIATQEKEQEIETPVAEVETEAEVPDQEEKPEKTFTQAELDKILKRRLDKEARRNDSKLSDLNARIEELSKAQKAIPTHEGEKDEAPKRADFDLYEDYLEARSDFKAKAAIRAELAELKAERAKEAEDTKNAGAKATLQKQADERIALGRKEYNDFDSVINEAFEDGVIEAGSELYFGIIDSDLGHRIAYYLAQPKNHDEAERIKNLSPRGIQRELGKLEVKLAGDKKPSRDTMEPLGGARPAIKSDPMRDDISMDEFVRLRNAADRKRRGL